MRLLKVSLISCGLSFLLSDVVHAFVSCPVPVEGQPQVECVQLAGQEEPQEVKDYLKTGSYLIERSIKTTSGVYLLLMTVGIFQRYIRGRI